MNRILASLLLVLASLLGHAQGTMNIYQTNGSILLIDLETIDSVTYLLTPPPPLMRIHQSGGSVLSLAVTEIDSITYSTGGTTGTPQIVTLPPVNLTPTAAQCGGYIASAGGSPVLVRGVCWSTTPMPTLSDNTTSDGPGIGTYTSNIAGLAPNTIYYARAYALNAQGVAYGNLVAFATLANGSQPTLSTAPITSIGALTAQSGGTILTDGGETILARGVCWSTSPNPTTANSLVNNGSGVGNYTSIITGLAPNTTYYARAWATNIYGTGYGNELQFTTTNGIPVLTTTAVSAVQATTASSGGTISIDGGAAITARGVCWSTSPDPTTANNVTTNGTGTGNFTSNLTGLQPSTTYYLRAYATNAVSTVYGNEVQFTTTFIFIPSSGVTDITGNTYSTIILNNGQEWMAENLSTTTYSNGDPIPNVTDLSQWDTLITGGWAHVNFDSQYEIPYGKLYNWYSVVDPRNVCPNGWHVPTDTEWTMLTNYLGGENVAGDKMRSTGTQYWLGPNNGATNESGFTGLPGGCVNCVGGVNLLTFSATWWSASETGSGGYWFRYLYANTAELSRYGQNGGFGHSVRCVKD
ncbi:MAG: fibrobacter succinogenes major paralogous domain-containing protein [Bacteroidetes bacterium]|nr:fibrobacter succinogenes major paralogous domain-containing protein [Bacteroidota bacterium]